MIVLDTNVISEALRSQPNPQVVSWLESLEDDVAIEPYRATRAVLAHLAFCATRNTTDFIETGAPLIDPWNA